MKPDSLYADQNKWTLHGWDWRPESPGGFSLNDQKSGVSWINMQSVLQKSEGLISLVYVLSLTSTDLKRDWIQHGSDPVSPVSSKRYFCAYSAHEVDDTIKLVFFFFKAFKWLVWISTEQSGQSGLNYVYDQVFLWSAKWYYLVEFIFLLLKFVWWTQALRISSWTGFLFVFFVLFFLFFLRGMQKCIYLHFISFRCSNHDRMKIMMTMTMYHLW